MQSPGSGTITRSRAAPGAERLAVSSRGLLHAIIVKTLCTESYVAHAIVRPKQRCYRSDEREVGDLGGHAEAAMLSANVTGVIWLARISSQRGADR